MADREKDYIVELREEEADELMNEHWVGELVRCKDCKNLGYTNSHWFCKWLNRCVDEDWFCADGERK